MSLLLQVKSRPEDSESQELHAFCGDPALHICMVRGLCAALEMNLDLYSSRTLTQTCPNHEIEVREQVGSGEGGERGGEGLAGTNTRRNSL